MRQYDGELAWGLVGNSSTIDAVGDLDGDGIGDYAIGHASAQVGALDFAGMVLVYSGATGVEITRFEGTTLFQKFGTKMAGVGDINGDGFGDLLISSPSNSPSFSGGTVEAISGADGSQLFFFDASANFTNMGSDVSAAGDVDNDGTPDLLIGENLANPGIGAVGSAYVYSGANGSLIHRFDGPVGTSGFGVKVSDAGDVNADGYADVMIHASGTHAGPFSFVGSVFVYSGFDGTQLYRFDGSSDFESFGFGISALGDLNSDGFDDFLIGSPGNDLAASDAGAGFVYSGFDGSILFTILGSFFDNMGRECGAGGDVNGDGIPDILLGSIGQGAGGTWAGRAWIYSGADASLLHQMDGANADDYLGSAVCGIGDINQDGAAEVLVGSARVDVGGAINAGSVFVVGLDPHLHLNTDRIPAAAGMVLEIDIELPSAAAFYEYRTLMSVSGRGPEFFGIEIPLSYDGFLLRSYQGNYSFSAHSDLQGGLDANGDASATITFPAGAFSFLVGRTFWLATIANQPGFPPEYTTASVAVTFMP